MICVECKREDAGPLNGICLSCAQKDIPLKKTVKLDIKQANCAACGDYRLTGKSGLCSNCFEEATRTPTLSDIWKGHAEVWRQRQRHYEGVRKSAMACGHELTGIPGALEELCGNIAASYEAKSAQETEG